MTGKADVVLCKFGKNYDWVEIDPESDYIVDTVEPFLNQSTTSDLAKTRLQFGDNAGNKYSEKISDLVKSGIKLYYHDKSNIDLTKYPGVRQPGLMENLLEEIEVIVTLNNLS